MVQMTNLVYYGAVARRDGTSAVVAEHRNMREDMAEVAKESLEVVPQWHSRYSYTIKQRMFMFLMDEAFTYCAVVDEALGKARSFGFLERVREEFQLLLRSRGLDGARLERGALVGDFAAVFKHLAKPLVGVPQKEVDLDEDLNSDFKDHTALSPSASQTEHSHENGKREQEVLQEIMMTNSKATDKAGGRSEADERRRVRQHASSLWCKNVKIVLCLDLVVCCVLFAIWLGICRGFSCVSS